MSSFFIFILLACAFASLITFIDEHTNFNLLLKIVLNFKMNCRISFLFLTMYLHARRVSFDKNVFVNKEAGY